MNMLVSFELLFKFKLELCFDLWKVEGVIFLWLKNLVVNLESGVDFFVESTVCIFFVDCMFLCLLYIILW